MLGLTSLPALLLNPFAGVYVDRWDRKETMVTCDLIRAVVILSLPWLIRVSSHVPFYGCVFLLFAVASFFVPARLAMIPDLVPADRLSQANALFTASGMIGSTVILLIGALLVEWVGPTRSCFVNAASYAASAVFILPIVRQRRSPHPLASSMQVILLEVSEGITELWRNRKTRRVTGLLALLMGGAGASVVVGTVLVQKSLGSVTRDLGFLSLWIGIGMLCGSVAHGRWGAQWRRRRVLGLAFLGCGAALWIFVWAVLWTHSGVVASIAASILGFWVAPVGIVANTLVHEGHPERLHGRVFSSLGVVVNGALIGSMLVAGWLVKAGGHGLFLVSIGGIFALSGMILLCYAK